MQEAEETDTDLMIQQNIIREESKEEISKVLAECKAKGVPTAVYWMPGEQGSLYVYISVWAKLMNYYCISVLLQVWNW